MNTLDVSRWLWDFYLLSTLLLLAVVVVGIVVKQPARRNALAWATAVSLLALACLTTLPNWSRLHLSSPAPTAPALTADLQPVFGQAVQQTQVIPAVPTEGLPPDALPAATQILVIDLGVISLYAFAVGSAMVFTWLALGAWQVRRLRAGAETAPAMVRGTLESLAPTKAKQIQLGVRSDLPVAVAVGLSRPCILLPQTLVAEANQQQLRSVLAHELAHVEHRDLWLIAVLRGLMVLLWPHPLFWFLRRRVRLDQEILADAAAADLSSRGEYAEQLVALARTAMEIRVPRLASSVGLWEKPSQLKRRIALLLDENWTILRRCSRGWRVGTFLALVGVAIGLSLVTLTPKEAEAQLAKPDNEDATVVADESEKVQTTNIVEDFFEAITPNAILGICVDEHDKPISGVEVEIFRAQEGAPHQPITIASTKSGVDGKFRFENVVDAKREFPEGLPDENFVPWGSPVYNIVARTPRRVPGIGNELAFQIARRGKVELFKLPPAQSLNGRVIDRESRPVAGARVSTGIWGEVVGIPDNVNSAKTDANGEFVIDDLESYNAKQAEQDFIESQQNKFTTTLAGSGQPWERFLTIKHPDFAMKRAKITNIPGNLKVTLSLGAVLTGQVVTREAGEESKPAAETEVTAMRLPTPGLPQEFSYQILTGTADQTGAYRFESLPEGVYTVHAYKPSWVTSGVEEIKVIAGEKVAVPPLSLTRGGRVQIQLIDDATGDPLQFAEVTKAYVNPSHRPLKKNVFAMRPNIVEFSLAAVGEIQLPAGNFAIMVSIPAKESSPGWMAADFNRIESAEDYSNIPAYEVIDGELIELKVRMVKQERSPKARVTGTLTDGNEQEPGDKPTTHFIPATPPAEIETQEEAEKNTGQPSEFDPEKSMSPDRRYVPVTPDGARNQERRDRDAYENGIFVPTEKSGIRK